MANPSELIEDPHWFPAAIIDDYRGLRFAQVSRETLSAEAFLDQRMQDSVTGWQSIPITDLLSHTQALPPRPPAFIFHSAFCCSTLLARALDVPGSSLALKEPDVLMGLANALRTGGAEVDNDALTDLILGLLARRFEPDEAIVVKPTYSANNLLPRVASRGARVLILYGDLSRYLISVLKKGAACKSFERTQYNIFGLDPGGLAAIPARQAMTFTDLQVAALVWRHQMELFQQSLDETGSDRFATLHYHDFLDRPVEALAAVATHLGLPLDRNSLEGVVRGPVFARNAKFADQAYDLQQRQSDASALQSQYGHVLETIEQWASTLNLGTDVRLPLTQGLDI